MKKLITTLIFSLTVYASGCSQPNGSRKPTDKIVGGGCDGCELMYEAMPPALSWETTMVARSEPGDLLIISGTVYKKDGRTPAPGIILYVYHTDSKGYYSTAPGQSVAKRHGHLRGWMKTDANGKYQFRTIRPAPYPKAKIPAHIHPTIKEPGLSEYYIDEYLFDDDSLLTSAERSRQEKRGGSGIIKLTKNANGEWIGTRDIVLGLNIPGY